MNQRDEQILANLPAILDNILAEHRATHPNPVAGLDLPVEGGPLNGQVHHNVDLWQGDWWEPEIEEVQHRYVLGTRIRNFSFAPDAPPADPPEHLWLYRGVVNPANEATADER